jgi:hypothetical protein
MTVKIYKAFLASPGDTKEERVVAEKVVAEINQTLGEHKKFRLELLKWENDTRPGFGKDGQDVINTQIGLDYDIFIGLMWKRFGTPTGRAESGTEEEFERAYKEFKEKGNIKILFYFNSSPIPQDGLDLTQLQKIQEFKGKVSSLGGYYWAYDSIQSFEKFLRQHLTKYMLELTENKNEQHTLAGKQEKKPINPQIKPSFNLFLNDTEVNFAHSRVDNVTLEDIYIPPDLRDFSTSKKDSIYKVNNLDDLSNAIDVEGIKYVLIGNESSGKSAGCKFLYTKYFNLGLFPVLINGSDINNNISPETITKILEAKIAEQYEAAFNISDFNSERFIIIIDDFQKSAKGKNRYWPILIKNIESKFINVIVTGNPLMLIENISKHEVFKNFTAYSILEFGPKFRAEIVNKWNTLGVEPRFFDKNELHRKNDTALAHIKTIIGKNYIPSYPFYLLSILQAMESGNVQNPNYSIHGFYYELIINESFNKAVKDKKEISLYYNYLTYFSYYLFEAQLKEVSLDDFKKFHTTYCAKYDLTYSVETILKTFDSAKLLHVNNKVHVKEKYVYYFFVAKYIANNINKPEVKELVTKMSIRIFRDEYASIIMFITHLSKDKFIIEELIKNADSIFSEIQPAMLQEDIKGINELINNIPQQVLELVDVQDKRKEELEDQEETERMEKELEKEASNYDNFNLDDDVSTIDFIAKLTLAMKTIDILGQITKKHWGEIDGEQKLKLVMATYNLGLRTLNIYLQYLQNNSKEIIEQLKQIIVEKHIKDRFSLKEAIKEASRDFIFKMCFMSTWGVTKRVANSIGYDKLKNTFEKALEMQPTNCVKLIDLAIKLGYAGIPMDIIKEYKHQMKDNKLSYVMLQNLVIDHMYMFDTDYKIKDAACSVLEISLQSQLKIDSLSTVKKS